MVAAVFLGGCKNANGNLLIQWHRKNPQWICLVSDDNSLDSLNGLLLEQITWLPNQDDVIRPSE